MVYRKEKVSALAGAAVVYVPDNEPSLLATLILSHENSETSNNQDSRCGEEKAEILLLRISSLLHVLQDHDKVHFGPKEALARDPRFLRRLVLPSEKNRIKNHFLGVEDIVR